MADNLNLMVSIMDSIPDWIIVISVKSREVLYVNKVASENFYNMKTGKLMVFGEDDLIERLKSYSEDMGKEVSCEFKCDKSKKTLLIKSYLAQWGEEITYVHYISDFTNEKEYRTHMENMAYTDELTGLFNRRYCFETLEGLINERKEFSICSIDLDHLKYVNDNYGHLKGDEYINAFVKAIEEEVRSTDIVARTGGDEFLAVFMNCMSDTVHKKMISVNEKLKKLSKEYPMSVSYGVFHVAKNNSLTMRQIIKQTDDYMYLQKNNKKHSI